MMLILNMEASFGDVTGPIRIGVPYYTLEPLVNRILEVGVSLDEPLSKPARWQEVYDDILVPLSAEWDAFELTVRDLLALRVDDVIEMPAGLIKDTKLRIEDRTCFVGEIGLEGEQVAFEVNETCIEANNLMGKSHG